MSITQSTLLGTGIFFVSIFLSGIWLKRSGKPYNTLIVTFHKLISLAAVAYIVRAIIRTHRATPLGTNEWLLVVITGVIALITVVSGGIVSIDKPMPVSIGIVHRVAPILTVLATVLSMAYLLPGG